MRVNSLKKQMETYHGVDVTDEAKEILDNEGEEISNNMSQNQAIEKTGESVVNNEKETLEAVLKSTRMFDETTSEEAETVSNHENEVTVDNELTLGDETEHLLKNPLADKTRKLEKKLDKYKTHITT